MKERPILFSGEMVRAILGGRKTQTRRVVDFKKIARQSGCTKGTLAYSNIFKSWAIFNGNGDAHVCLVNCPYGVVGDRLWVRERWAWKSGKLVSSNSVIQYYADGGDLVWDTKWRPSIHMRRWASRIMLEITGIRVERVKDITEEDARAEGIIDGGCLNCGNSEPCGCNEPSPDARDAFAWLWNSINEPRGYGWDANPFVWVVEFGRVS
jgi:hypothetical protein